MSDARLPWTIAAVALLALGFSEYRASTLGEQEQVTSRRVQALEARMPAAIGRHDERFEVPATAGKVAPGIGLPVRGSTPAVVPAQELARQQTQVLQALDARFRMDGTDPRWATTTEDAVSQAVVDPTLSAFAGPLGSDVRCMRSMCRMVFTFDSMSRADDWMSYFPVGLATALPRFQSVQTVLPDGRVELHMFGFRR